MRSEGLCTPVLPIDPHKRSLSLRYNCDDQNRFGSSHEIGVFEMTSLGLEEVANPSLLFTSTALDTDAAYGSDSEDGASAQDSDSNALPDGTAVLVAMEGTRPLLCELQVRAHVLELCSGPRCYLYHFAV